MVLIVKKLVPVYPPDAKVPKKYKNLRKAVYVTTFKYAYNNLRDILINEYRLDPTDKIVIFWTKAVQKRGWREWRLPFRKVYSGYLKDYE